MPSDTVPMAPEKLPIVATPVLLLIHVPPGIASFNVTDEPIHTPEGPVIGFGIAFIVTVRTWKQPVVSVYDIVAVPAFTPNTTPVGLTVALSGSLVDHVPSGVVLPRLVVALTQTTAVPVMAAGNGLTVIE